MITIYHNPRCSKSRAALAMLQQFTAAQNLPLSIVEYLNLSPSVELLKELRGMIGCPATDMVRSNEEEYASLFLDQADEESLIQAVSRYPILLQRPIVCYREKAVIARSPERLAELLAEFQ